MSNWPDQGQFTLEERIVTSTSVHEPHNAGDTLNAINEKFKERFKKNPPTRQTMSKWESKLFEIGNAKNASRSGRPMKHRESCKSSEQSIIIYPLKSTRKRLAEHGIPRTTIKKDLEVKTWWPCFVNELSNVDREKRKLACDELLQINVLAA